MTAIAYGLFAAALIIVAVGFFSASSKRRAALFKWGWNVTIAAVVIFLSGRLVWLAQWW